MNWNKIKSKTSVAVTVVLALAIPLLICKCNAFTDDQANMHANHPAQQTQGATADSLDLTRVLASPNQVVLSNQETFKVAKNSLPAKLHVPGYVTVDPRRTRKIVARVTGRIEKLYVRYPFQFVRKGDKLLELFSPELRVFQEEYKYLLTSEANQLLIENSRKKLLLLGLTDRQIKQLELNGETTETITLYCPYTGYVIEEKSSSLGMEGSSESADDQGVNSTGSMSGMTNDGRTTTYARSQSMIKEGSYVNAGDALISVNDLHVVWGIFHVDSKDRSVIYETQPLRVRSELYPEHMIRSRIQYVEPAFQPGQKSISFRTYLGNNRQKLTINSLLTAELHTTGAELLWVPSSSVLDLGRTKAVWVLKGITDSGKKIFEIRKIVTGRVSEDRTEIKGGLKAHEEIALDAGYLADSESLILVSR